jgi:S-methyl-5-thioribose kinase
MATYAAVDGSRLAGALADIPLVRERLGGAPPSWRIREVGDGNLNLVFIVEGNRDGVVVKQALPYVRLVGESWPLPLERSWFEYRALTEQARHAPGLTPEVFHFDRAQAMIVMEYLRPHVIMRKGLIRGIEYPRFASDIAEFLAATLFNTSALAGTAADHKARVELFAPNTALCKITEDLVFTDPYREAPLNRWTRPWLDAQKQAFERDSALKVAAQTLKLKFMTSAEALIHGDLHTGSIMATSENTRVIDPEFAFIGPMGFDVGAVIGNLLLAYFAQSGHEAAPHARGRLPRMDTRASRARLVGVPRSLSRLVARGAFRRRLSREPLSVRRRPRGDGEGAGPIRAGFVRRYIGLRGGQNDPPDPRPRPCRGPRIDRRPRAAGAVRSEGAEARRRARGRRQGVRWHRRCDQRGAGSSRCGRMSGRLASMQMAASVAIAAALLLAAMARAQALAGGRVLTPMDVVAIRIVDHPDLDWTVRVEPDGTINFPYVGRIKAAGLTEDDLARTVERRLVALKIIAEP